jgi:hypothetical protein
MPVLRAVRSIHSNSLLPRYPQMAPTGDIARCLSAFIYSQDAAPSGPHTQRYDGWIATTWNNMSNPVHLKGEENLLRARLEQRRGHYMPPSLLATLEDPDDAITVDISGAPEAIVKHIRIVPAHLED